VVVESAAADFFEARVLEVTADRVRVQVLASGDTRKVALGDVYRLDAARALAVGEPGICKLDKEWCACRVVTVSKGELEVETADGDKSKISAAQVIAPTAVTVLNIERRFTRARERREFTAALRAAGRPRAPSGWKASPQEAVIARTDDGWYAATVFELGKTEHRVRWKGSGRISDVGVHDVVPLSHTTLAVKRGEFALARPLSPASPWQPVQLESVADNDVVGRDADGVRRTIALEDLVPVRP